MMVGWCLVMVVSMVLWLSVRFVLSGMLIKFRFSNCVDIVYIMKFGIGVSMVVFGLVVVMVIRLMILFELLFSSILVLVGMCIICLSCVLSVLVVGIG